MSCVSEHFFKAVGGILIVNLFSIYCLRSTYVGVGRQSCPPRGCAGYAFSGGGELRSAGRGGRTGVYGEIGETVSGFRCLRHDKYDSKTQWFAVQNRCGEPLCATLCQNENGLDSYRITKILIKHLVDNVPFVTKCYPNVGLRGFPIRPQAWFVPRLSFRPSGYRSQVLQ